MYVTLSKDFFANPTHIQDHAVQIEELISAHTKRQIIFSLSPSGITALIDQGELGPRSRAIIPMMMKRSQDYVAGANLARRIAILYPDSKLETNFRISNDGNIEAKISHISKRLETSSTRFYVEHVANDCRIAKLIFELISKSQNITSELVNWMPAHGGGTTISDVLRSEHENTLVGLCLTDRDTHPNHPDLCKTGGTAHAASQALCELNVMPLRTVGYSPTEPMFGFILTAGRTIESYIGPNLLDFYFDNNQQSVSQRRKFIDAYGNFPNLNDMQMKVWLSKNLKDGGVSPKDIASGVVHQGGVIDVKLVDLIRATLATVPRDSSEWLSSNLSGRHHRGMLAAFKRDFSNETYRHAVMPLFEMTWDLLAADPRMKLA